MPLPSPYTWTTRVSGNSSANRPYNLLDGNLRKYDNDFSSATVNWTPVNISGATPTAGVSGGTFNQTSSVVGLELYRTTSGLTAPSVGVEVDCSAFSTGSRTVDTYVGVGLAHATQLGYIFYRYNCKTHAHEIVRRAPGGAEELVQGGVTQTLTAPFTLSFALQGKFIVGRATSAGSSVDTILMTGIEYIVPGLNLRKAADLANYRVAWLAGSVDADLATGSTASVTINAVRSAVFGGVSIREQYPVATKADGGPVTDGTGRILMLATNESIVTTSEVGFAHLGLRWYDPATYTFSDCITRIYSMRPDGTIGGDSDGCVVYDDVLKQWHIYVTATDTAGGNSGFKLLYQRYDSNLLNAGVAVLDNQTPVTLPSGLGITLSSLLFDAAVRYIVSEWYIFFELESFTSVLAKGSRPDSFTTHIATVSGNEGTKFAKLDGTWYALAGGPATEVYDLAGVNQGNTLMSANPAGNTYQPHPSIAVEQYNDGANKRRYHHVTFEDSLTTADGHDWTSQNAWQFGSTFSQTTEARTGWDHAVNAADFSSYSPAAPDYAVTSAGTTPSGRALTFTVTPSSSWTATVTPSVALAGLPIEVTGAFSPTTLSWSASATPKTFTFTPTSEGVATIYFRNSSTENDPPSARISVESAWVAQERQDNPIGWWRLGTGYTISNLIENGPAGSPTVTLTDVAGLLPAETDHALLFAGGVISIQNDGVYQISTGTIKAWIKTSSPGASFRGIFGKSTAFDVFLVDGVLGAYDWGGGAFRTTGVNLADGVAHEVAMSFQSGVTNGTKIYIDGLPVLTTTITITSQATGLTIGTSGGGQEFAGTIDECRIYGTVLSDARILASYTAAITTVDTTAPTVTFATDTSGNPIATFSESVTGVAYADYSFTGRTTTGVSGSGTTWTFTTSPAVANGDTVTASYAGTATVDGSTNQLVAFSGRAVTNNVPPLAANTPTGLAAFAGNTAVALTWNPNTGDGTVLYSIYRSTSGGAFTLAFTVSGASNGSASDTGRVNGTTYAYKISASNSVPTESALSAASNNVVPAAPIVLANAGLPKIFINGD